MQTITTIGLDIAKSVFQVHGVDAQGKGHPPSVEASRRPGFLPETATVPNRHRGLCLSHHWSRELQALGHTVRLMPPAYVKPYVKRQKNDTATPRRSARQSQDPICGSCPPRHSSNRVA